jgi:hypothetical protein
MHVEVWPSGEIKRKLLIDSWQSPGDRQPNRNFNPVKEQCVSDSKNDYMMKGKFTEENSVLVLIDYQVGTMRLIRSSSSDVCLRNAVTLATTAKTLKMPVVLTSSQETRYKGLFLRHCRRSFPTHSRLV